MSLVSEKSGVVVFFNPFIKFVQSKNILFFFFCYSEILSNILYTWSIHKCLPNFKSFGTEM